MSTSLFDTAKYGDIEVKNRFVMAPMTRSRADHDGVQPDIAAIYYAQRATAGLIVTEGTAPSEIGKGYLRIPGLYTAEQGRAWRKITEAVHAREGKIVAQIMHCGRIAHPDNLKGQQPVSSSETRAAGQMFTMEGPKDHPIPRALTLDEIKFTLGNYRQAAELAFESGFDGVELHGTSGYLPVQFLAKNINHRTDEYGGTLENRARFMLEALDALISVNGSGRVGIKLGPVFPFNDVDISDAEEVYTYLVAQLNSRNLAYLEVIDNSAMLDPKPNWDVTGKLRELYKGNFIANGGYDKARATQTLADGRADAIAFGSLYLANPDLPQRFAQDAPLNSPDPATFYMGEEKGYTDYPTL